MKVQSIFWNPKEIVMCCKPFDRLINDFILSSIFVIYHVFRTISTVQTVMMPILAT